MAGLLSPDDEILRLEAVLGYEVLDTPAEPAFDDLAQLAASACAAPVALVSLVDRDRQWFKARIGLEAPETDLSHSVCRFVVAERAMVVIPDLTADPRTRDNPMVTVKGGIRFYAGAPLTTADGHVLGSLCVIDHQPRPGGLSPAQRADLEALARRTVDVLETRRIAQQLSAAIAARDAADATRDALIKVGDALRDAETAAEMTLMAARIVGEALGASRASYGMVDAAVDTVTIEPGWAAEGVSTIAGRYRYEDFGRISEELKRGEPLAISDVLTDPRTADDPGPLRALDIGAIVNMPVRERGRTVAVFIVHFQGVHAWTASELSFIRNVADRLEVGVARLRAEEQQDVLNREISHRLKNTLSMVQAVSAQTLRGIADQDAARALERRLLALGRAHDVLMQSSWQMADLQALLERVLQAAGVEGRYVADGPAVMLGAKAALSTSLLIHELATNALKYGALTVGDGRVRIAWQVEGHGAGRELVLAWTEVGGPPAETPAHRGFGSRLLGAGLAGTGGAELHYGDEGFSAIFRAALEQVQQA